MKRFFLLFFVCVASLGAQSVVAPTNEDLYKMLDSTFYWSEYGLPEVTPLERAQALCLPGSELKSAKEKLSSFTLFLALRNLFFHQYSQYESSEYAWAEMKSILDIRYGIKLNKLNLYSEVDWEILRDFAIQARKTPTVILPAIVAANCGNERIPVVVRQNGDNKISGLVFRFRAWQENISMSAIPTDWNTDFSVGGDMAFDGLRYSIGSIRFDGGYTSAKRWVQGILNVPTNNYVGMYRVAPLMSESGWSDNQGNDGYVWAPLVYWRIYQRGDLNLNFNLSLGDAIIGSNLLLSDSLPVLPNLMDITCDGNSDQNDLLAIFQQVTRGWWGGKGRVIHGGSENSEASPSGKLIAEKFIRDGRPMVRVIFEGENPGSSLALKISSASKAVFLGSSLKALSASRENEGVLRVLRFEENPRAGFLLEAEMSGEIKLEPLKNYFFAPGENISIAYRNASPTSVKEDPIPSDFGLNQNYPNPFNPETVISFNLPEVSKVRLGVYNALGELITTLADGEFSAGRHALPFSGSGLASGIYFYRLETNQFSKTMKMILSK